jgi:hypothetical protein
MLGGKMTNLQFRREVVSHYLSNYGTTKKTAGRTPKNLPNKTNNEGHFVRFI